MKIYSSFSELVGNTPLYSAKKYAAELSLTAEILCKLEYFNPAGSVKDRAALYMIEKAESVGALKKGAVIIEPTSGNTGIGLAAVGVPRGYRVILTMPDTMSVERRKLLAAYGAEIVLTDGALGMKGAIDKANEIASRHEGSFIPSQFENPANPLAHYETTGPEIYRDTDGNIDFFVAGVGTGGTLTGISRYLKEKNPNVKVVAVEPYSSPLLSGGNAAPHGLQGIGANFIPENLDRSAFDEVIAVTEESAYAAARLLAKCEGLLVGISSGAALYAASEIAKRKENQNKRIVVLLPDGGDRYLSTPLFE